MSDGIPRCPVCAHVVESVRDEAGWWALPCGHALGRWNFEDLRAQLEAARPPWRFDVPEVPDSVTAFKDGDDAVWLRLPDNQWALLTWGLEYIRWCEQHAAQGHKAGYPLIDLLHHQPLVECPDPRAAS